MSPRDRRPLIVAASLLLVSRFLGLDWLDALLVGLATFVLMTAATTSSSGAEHPWPPAPLDEAPGARSEVSALTWSFFGLDGRVSEVAVRRLRVEATRRLAKQRVIIPGGLNATTATSGRVDPDVIERARTLLGERAWSTLTGAGGLLPSIRDIAHCVDVLEGLEKPPSTLLSDRSPSSSQPRGPQP